MRLEPELELELKLAHTALVAVLVPALNGELKVGWHRKCRELDTLAASGAIW
jgi:hypothetical protein